MDFRYFKIEDFACSETGENGIKPEFVLALDDLRHKCGFPFVVTSGFRSKDHSIEKTKKSADGTHAVMPLTYRSQTACNAWQSSARRLSMDSKASVWRKVLCILTQETPSQ